MQLCLVACALARRYTCLDGRIACFVTSCSCQRQHSLLVTASQPGTTTVSSAIFVNPLARSFASGSLGDKRNKHQDATGLDVSAATASGHEASAQTPELQGTSSSVLQRYISPELVTDVSSTINKLTGYENIDRLKASVATVDEALTACKRQLQAAKLQYDQQLAHQTQLHREVTALLQRKSSWVPADVSRFTELYAAEHETEKAVATAKAAHTALSDDVDLLQLKLVDLIRERYQQEQAWSDKIRRASTWWTWGLMGLHFASFVAVYTFLEPRKRQALTDAVANMLQQHTASIDAKLTQLVHDADAAAGAGAVPTSQDRKHSNKQQQQRQSQHQDSQDSVASQLQESAVVQQRVLQELTNLQQQLQQLQTATLSSSSAAAPTGRSTWDSSSSQPRWWQLPSRQWVSQQVSAAGSAAARSWQAIRFRSQEVSAHFNPLQPLNGSQQAAQVDSSGPTSALSADTQSGSSSSSSRQGQASADANSSASMLKKPSSSSSSPPPVVSKASGPHDPSGKPEQLSSQQQKAASSQAEHAAVSIKQHTSSTHDSSTGRGGLSGLLAQLWSGGSEAINLSRTQLAVLGAASTTCGAAVGAVLVLMLRPGFGGAAGTT